jgi:hypothetical protein
MAKYIMKQLTKYGHVAPLKPQHCLYLPNPIKYGKDNQAPSPLNDCPLLNEAEKKRIQLIVSSILYYARAVDPTIIMALSETCSQQAAPTENTMKHVNQFLDYIWTHPDAVIQYRASDMILNVHSDVSYLSTPKACSRAGGYYFLGIYHAMETQSNSMEPFTSHAPSSSLLLPLLQKPNWVHFS